MNTSKEKYYQFTGEVPEGCDVYPFFPMTNEEVSRIRELTVEAYKTYIGPDYDDNWASTFEEVCEDCELWQLQGFNAELDELLFNSFDECDGYPFTIFSIDLQHGYTEKEMENMYGEENEESDNMKVLFDTGNGDTSISLAPDKAARLVVYFDEETTSFDFEIVDIDGFTDKSLSNIDTTALMKALGAESYDEASIKLKDLIREHDFFGPLFKIKEFLDNNNVKSEFSDHYIPHDEFEDNINDTGDELDGLF